MEIIGDFESRMKDPELSAVNKFVFENQKMEENDECLSFSENGVDDQLKRENSELINDQWHSYLKFPGFVIVYQVFDWFVRSQVVTFLDRPCRKNMTV